MDTYTDISLLGTTRDDAIGESFDKIGRMIGIEYPAGKGFDALSREGFIKATGSEEGFYQKYKKSEAYKNREMLLPSPALRDGSLDFSFSGLKTAAINLLHRYEQRGEEIDRALFAARYTFEAVEAVALKIDEALLRNPGCDFVMAGGVAANSHLRARLTEVAKRRGVKIFIPPFSLCGDNGAMIAAQGYFEYLKNNFADASLNASALDSVV
jgi:N6-L-threonylcarbamoyladenine synthase